MNAYFRCLPNYLTRCDCTLQDQMLGRDCGIETRPVRGGSDTPSQAIPLPEPLAPAQGGTHNASGRRRR